MRQPLEHKIVTISRASGSLTFPANFMLVAAANPCSCGYYGDPVKECTCSHTLVTRYQKGLARAAMSHSASRRGRFTVSSNWRARLRI